MGDLMPADRTTVELPPAEPLGKLPRPERALLAALPAVQCEPWNVVAERLQQPDVPVEASALVHEVVRQALAACMPGPQHLAVDIVRAPLRFGEALEYTRWELGDLTAPAVATCTVVAYFGMARALVATMPLRLPGRCTGRIDRVLRALADVTGSDLGQQVVYDGTVVKLPKGAARAGLHSLGDGPGAIVRVHFAEQVIPRVEQRDVSRVFYERA